MNHDNPDATEETKATPEQIRRATVCSSLETCYRSHEGEKEARKGTRPAVDVARDYLADRTRPEDWKIKNSRTAQHITNRLAYEWQMLEAQGGRAALVEMVKGGTLAGMVIHKLNKSNATGRTVSVDVITRENKLHSIQTERLAENAYNEPTEESLARLAEFEALLSAHKKALPKAPPLINPTLADAQKLQDIINERHAAKWQKHHGKPSEHYKPKAGEVAKMTQAQYSAAAAGSYARHETKEFHAMGEVKFGGWNSSAHRAQHGTIICKLRATGYDPINLIHITDKPSKPLPAEMFQTFNHGHTPEALAPRAREIVEATAARNRTPEQQALALAAEVAGLAKGEHMTEEGHNWARELGAYNAPAAPTPTAAPFTLTA